MRRFLIKFDWRTAAEGVVFSDGKVAVTSLMGLYNLVTFNTIEDMGFVYREGSEFHIEWID